MYYGNIGVADVQDEYGTYDSDYIVAHHFEETSGLHFNSVSVFNQGNPNGVNQNTDGQVGGADDFNGLDDFVDLGSHSSIDDIFFGGGTVSAWIFPEGWGESNWGRVVDKANGINADVGWSIQLDNSNVSKSIRFETGFSETHGAWNCAANAINLNEWQHIAVVFNSDDSANDPIFYINGNPCSLTVQFVSSGNYQPDGALGACIGNISGGTSRTFDGTIDEVQMSGVARPVPWITAQYLSMSDNFITYSDEDKYCP